MKNTHNYLFLLGLIFLFTACSSARKSFEKQQYEKAIKLALKSLEKNKSVKESKNILQRSLVKVEREKYKQIQEKSTSDNLEDKVEAFEILSDLDEMYEKSIKYLDTSFSTKHDYIHNDWVNLRENISQSYFSRGQQNLTIAKKQDQKDLAQNAYYDFIESRKYGNIDRAVDSFMQASIDFGTITYVVQADPVFDISQSWEIDRTFDNIVNQGGIFRRVFFEPIGMPENIDCIIDIDFVSLDITNRDFTNTQNFTERVIVDYKITQDTSGKQIKEPIYGDVQGSVLTTDFERLGEWDVRVNVMARSKHCQANDENFEESFTSKVRKTTLQGDERAIPSQYKNTMNMDELMDEDDIAEELINQIYQRIINLYFR